MPLVLLYWRSNQPAKMSGLKTTVLLRISPLDRIIPLHRKSSQPAKMSRLKMTGWLRTSTLTVRLQLNLRSNHWLTLIFLEHCQGFTLAGQPCQRKIKTGRYCHIHRREGSHIHKKKRKTADRGLRRLFCRKLGDIELDRLMCL